MALALAELPVGEIQTYTGQYLSPLDLDPDDVDIRDIAHALSLQCRFTGHTSVFYSVAEHSVRVCRRVAELGGEKDERLWGLLHDASEAYLVDLPRPLKHLPGFGKAYLRAEIQAMAAICDRFGLYHAEPYVVKVADRQLLLMEQRDLMPYGEPYEVRDDVPSDLINPWSPREAERIFLKAFSMLYPL